MNRCERDYCSKGFHPRWKAWTAKYAYTGIPGQTKWQGDFCIYCGAKVDGVSDIPPDRKRLARLRVLRGKDVEHADYRHERERLIKYSTQRSDLLWRIRSRSPNKNDPAQIIANATSIYRPN